MPQDNAHEKVIIVFDVRHENTQQVVPVPGHRITFDDLVSSRYEIFEHFGGLGRVAFHPDVAEDVHAAPDPCRIDQPDVATQDPVGLQCADASPA